MCDSDFDNFLDNLETDVDADGNFTPKAAKEQPREKFPCEHCDGTGKYRGPRVHQEKSHCFACKGKGYFLTSKYDRMKARRSASTSKARKLEKAREAFEDKNPGLIDFICKASEWSSFAGALSASLDRYGALTEKQLAAAISMREKSEARQREKEAQRASEEKKTPSLDRLAEAFLTSGANLKFPKLRLRTEDGLKVVLSRCGDRSRTPGHINITDGRPFGENVFYGRIDPEGRAFLKDGLPDTVKALLESFDADPHAEIKVQGQRTGECCCCGRELTDASSIAAGIGPVCATKWGF